VAARARPTEAEREHACPGTSAPIAAAQRKPLSKIPKPEAIPLKLLSVRHKAQQFEKPCYAKPCITGLMPRK